MYLFSMVSNTRKLTDLVVEDYHHQMWSLISLAGLILVYQWQLQQMCPSSESSLLS